MPDNWIKYFVTIGGSLILLLLIFTTYKNYKIESTCLNCDVKTTFDKDSTHVIKYCILPYDKENGEN